MTLDDINMAEIINLSLPILGLIIIMCIYTYHFRLKNKTSRKAQEMNENNNLMTQYYQRRPGLPDGFLEEIGLTYAYDDNYKG